MDIKFTKEVNRLLEKSRDEAVRHNNSAIRPEHLLLAIMLDIGSPACVLLEKAASDVSAYQLQQELDDELFDLSPQTGAKLTVGDLTNRIIKLSALEARLLKMKWLSLCIFFWPFSTIAKSSQCLL